MNKQSEEITAGCILQSTEKQNAEQTHTLSESCIDAMRQLVAWKDLEDFCKSRDGVGCKGCPYRKHNRCDRASMVDVMNYTANIFREFLEE